MDTIRRAAEDIQHEEGVAKMVQTIWRKIVLMKPNIQTAKRTILNFQELAICTKKREEEEIMEVK